MITCLELIQMWLTDDGTDPARTYKDLSNGIFRMFDRNQNNRIEANEIELMVQDLAGIFLGLFSQLVGQLNELTCDEPLANAVTIFCQLMEENEDLDSKLPFSIQEISSFIGESVEHKELYDILMSLKASVANFPPDLWKHDDVERFFNNVRAEINTRLLTLGSMAKNNVVSLEECLSVGIDGARKCLDLLCPLLLRMEGVIADDIIQRVKQELKEKSADLLWNDLLRAILPSEDLLRQIFRVSFDSWIEFMKEEGSKSYLQAVMGLIDPKGLGCVDFQTLKIFKSSFQKLVWSNDENEFKTHFEKLQNLLFTSCSSENELGCNVLNREEIKASFGQLLKTSFGFIETTTKMIECMVAKSIPTIVVFIMQIKFHMLKSSSDEINLDDMANFGKMILQQLR